MRYKFRGKNVENGRWVYGDLVQRGDRTYITELEDTYGYYQMAYVNSETIGQYTGLTDKNGVEIYEGDIIQARVRRGDTYKLYIISYDGEDKACYVGDDVETGGDNYELLYDLTYSMYVIGNIYDNPDLLKGGGDE